ncbi:D-alanyl-D-alanine carboxypeptidase family protein [Roseburia sp. 1XD42-69]|uniref:D-alanyl-D-alanine carboxypeptidase family protein n=1 Tax=Roseburia sp. 1XD42-69 TaxID=2320088 RepID=UPI000EA17A0F|nr:D-alanyl-D-alanine carboxypeptidase family protein [Roseburia sp. 1XD42-69]RKJ68426.1 D-alanyl-D-alanine carboxypeptidase [Roseburia sp. 1XD42-69]
MHTLLSLLLCCQILLTSCLPGIFSPVSNFLFFTQSSNPPESQSGEFAADEAVSASITAPSAILMEASTGTIIYEKNAHEVRHPASITKIMTLNLIFEALEQGKFHLNDTVTVSEHAASMGGSQVFLEAGETQDVETMIKCISIASANDASVAMAEFVGGSEEAFVASMNEKAKALGMKDTHFVNCCGLDVDDHMTSAYDIALMSRELTVKHPQIHDYCTIWMDSFTHNTAKGQKEFGLANTNKLIRQYEYATGLKTGSTSLAKFCLSATAEKDGMELIAVVMGAENPKNRFSDASTLLNYGFSKCRIYTDEPEEGNTSIPVKRGVNNSLSLSYANQFQYLSVKGEDFSAITKELSLPESVEAPVKEGEKVGEIIYKLGTEEIGTVDIIAKQDIEKADFSHYLLDVFISYFS